MVAKKRQQWWHTTRSNELLIPRELKFVFSLFCSAVTGRTVNFDAFILSDQRCIFPSRIRFKCSTTKESITKLWLGKCTRFIFQTDPYHTQNLILFGQIQNRKILKSITYSLDWTWAQDRIHAWNDTWVMTEALANKDVRSNEFNASLGVYS